MGTEMGSKHFQNIKNLFYNHVHIFFKFCEVSSIALNNQDKDVFLVGCDSGGLFKCSLSSQKKITLSKIKIAFF